MAYQVYDVLIQHCTFLRTLAIEGYDGGEPIHRIVIRFPENNWLFNRIVDIICKARRRRYNHTLLRSVDGIGVQQLEFECFMCGEFIDFSTYKYIKMTCIEGDTAVRIRPVTIPDKIDTPITAPPRTATTSTATTNNRERNENMNYLDTIKKCMFNGKSTIMMFNDGSKTVVKQIDSDRWDPEIGIAMAIAKSLFGTRSRFTKYVDSVVRESYAREATKLTEKELAVLIGDHSKVIKMEEEEIANKLKKDPTLSKRSLYTREYHYAKLFRDILTKELERRKKKTEARKKQQDDIRRKKKKTSGK